jgi:3-deoxy-D-manno-octulosonic-acid transferase
MGIIFYTFFLWWYRTGIRMVSPWNHKAKLWLEGRRNIFKQMEASGISSEKSLIWMHCASLGEFEQGRPVLEKLKIQYPELKSLITFFSPTAFEIHKNYPGAEYIFYLPFDSKQNAKHFLRLVHPKLVLWIKQDYWYHYLDQLKKKEIPLLLLSAGFRPDQPFFRWYGALHRQMLSCFTHLFVLTEQSKKMLQTIGISSNVSVSGDTRFDRVIETAENFVPVPGIEQFCGHGPVIVAGSTWYEDIHELDHFANSHPEVKFIVAPHEIDEESLLETESLFHRSVRYSQRHSHLNLERPKQILRSAGSPAAAEKPNVLIIDNIGTLSRLYKYGTLAYVGGGFGDRGVHNVLEAAVYGKPVICGPVIEESVEVTELVENGGTIVIDSALEAEEAFMRLLTNEQEYLYCSEASRNYVYAKRGATEKITRFIQENRLLTKL